MTPRALGALVQSSFTDHLPVQKGLRPGSIHSYRDMMPARAIDAGRPELRPGARVPEAPGGGARQQYPDTQSAPGGTQHVLRLPRLARTGDAGGLPPDRRNSGQTNLTARHPPPRTRGSHGVVPIPASRRSFRAARSHALAVSLQHRCPGPGSRRSSCRTSRA
mgnify:CR=1 FL=1